MESNKDAAAECFEKGKALFIQKKYDNSIYILKKSIRLYITEEAIKLLKEVEKKKKESINNNNKSNEENSQNRSEYGKERTKKTEEKRKTYTTEQYEIVKRILRCDNYYQTLELKKDANDSEIKKAYHRLALQIHPDKNKAPGADAAFKKLSKAFYTLKDSTQRKKYDIFGETSASTGDVFSEPNVTIDELINIFMYGTKRPTSRAREVFSFSNFDDVYYSNSLPLIFLVEEIRMK